MLILDANTSISLESQLDRLAFESNFITNLVDSFANVIPNLATKLLDSSNSFKNNFFEKPRVKDIKTAYENSSSVVAHADFVNYSGMLVSVPEGFKGNFMEYIKLLTRMSPVVYKEANGFIAEYNFILSDFLTNRETKKCNISHDAAYRKITASRETNAKSLEHYFTAKSDSSKAKLSSVIGRFADLKELSDLAIALEKTQSVSNLQDIADGIAKTIYLLDLIKKNLEDDKITEVCGVSASSISNGAYEVAKYVEFISIFRFKCDQASASAENVLKSVYSAIYQPKA